MKIRQRGIWMFVLILLLIVSGCTSKSSTETKNVEKNEEGQTVVRAFTSQTPNIIDFNDNLVTKKIEETHDIDIQFESTPKDGAKEKQNLLLASGDYPDVFVGGDFSGIEQLNYGQEGVLIPLNDLIEEHAPNIVKAFEEYPKFKEAITMPDGNIYGLPGEMGCYHCTYPIKMWMNTEWLDNLGLEMPETTAELEKVLLAFKNDDPNSNGKKDEVPLSGTPNNQEINPINFIMNAFTYTDHGSYLKISDGQLSFVGNTPEWKQGLAYLQNLYSQGLIDPQTFTQQEEGIKQLANKGDTASLGAFGGLWSGAVLTITDETADRWTKYEAIPPLTGPSGLKETVYTGDSVGSAKFAITDAASEEQQIAAIKIADYVFSSEGALDEMFGVKGEGWVPAEEGDIGVNGEPALFRSIGSLDTNKPTNTLWDNDFTFVTEDMYNGQMADQDTSTVAGYERFLYLQTKEKYEGHYPSELILNDVVDPSKAQRMAEIKTGIINFVQENAVQFIIGEKSLDKDWDTYLTELENIGVEEYVQIYQDSYDAGK